MKLNLDVLKNEIRKTIADRKIAIFYGYSRTTEELSAIYWDIHRYPQYNDFLDVAQAAGAKLIVFHSREFSAMFADNALEQMDEADFTAEERRSIERRLRELKAYDGFTCAIELSFEANGRTYLFDLRSEWYEEFTDLIDEIDVATSQPGDDGEGPIGGFYSQN